jgi:hypothetical protein
MLFLPLYDEYGRCREDGAEFWLNDEENRLLLKAFLIWSNPRAEPSTSLIKPINDVVVSIPIVTRNQTETDLNLYILCE